MTDRIEIEVLSGDGWTPVDAPLGRGASGAPRRPPRGRRWRPAVALGAVAALVIAAVTLSRTNATRHEQAAVSTSVLTRVAPSTVPSTLAPAVSIGADFEAHPSTSEPTDTFVFGGAQLGPLLPDATDTNLVALTESGTLIELDVDSGTLRRVDIRTNGSSEAANWIVAGSNWIVDRPFDNIPGFIVRDDPPSAHRLEHELAQGSFGVFPGPDDATVWVTVSAATGNALGSLMLVDLDGHPTGPHISIDGLEPIAPDGRGGVLVGGTGGTYDTDGSAMALVTTGGVLATGTRNFVTIDCDDSHRCESAVLDRAGGSRRVLDAMTAPRSWAPGTVSPDGRHATYVRYTGVAELRVVDLASGGEIAVGNTTRTAGQFDAAGVWSTDGRYLLFIDDQGTVSVWDAMTGIVAPLHPALPHMRELTARPRS